MFKYIRPAVSMLAFMTLLTGVAYPLAVTAVAQLLFPDQANGSLIHDANGQVRGSSLLAQDFNGDQWFQPRPSAIAFAADASGASNLAPSNPALRERIAQSTRDWHERTSGPVPMALVTTSASGLDPDLPPAAARYQVARIAAARGMALAELERLIVQHTRAPLVGPETVNVLALNLALINNSVHERIE